MLAHFANKATKTTIPLCPVTSKSLKKWLEGQSKLTKGWVSANGFKGHSGGHLAIPNRDGQIARVLVGTGEGPYAWAGLPNRLGKGRYFIDADLSPREADAAALGWALGTYEFTAYRKARQKPATLVWPQNANRAEVTRLVRGIFLARDLINTPTEDMGPSHLAAVASALAEEHGASCEVTVGDALLGANYPMIHAVGRAATNAPRLIDLRWGREDAPKVTLVGKGVCFDTGGLDLKPAADMKLMKKDMGGAALVLGLAHALMDAKLDIRLRVLVPAVENSVAGNAVRPLDVVRTRKGLTVEIGNTDAEGRLILCDALAEADSEKPDVIIDAATLTGAARVALGTDLPALFCNAERLASAILSAGWDEGDMLWRLPLHGPYRSQLKSSVADLSNISSSRYGGAITAALFLSEFVSPETPWAHIDTMAYNLESRAGRPSGGEALALRALYRTLVRRYAPEEPAPAEPAPEG